MPKDVSARRLFCSILFFSKVLIALSISLSIFAYFTSLVYQRHISAVFENNLQQERDRLGLKPPVVPIIPGQCNSVGNRLDAPSGSAYFGFSLDFAVDNVEKLVDRLGGKSTAVINAFTTINTTWFDRDQINWWCSSTGKVGGILELSVDPSEDVNNLQNAPIFNDFAKFLAGMNSQYGVPILLRYGHEMNGYWNIMYGMKPVPYISTFRTLTNALRAQTNMTAMFWNPNIGTGYPFGGSASQMPPVGSPDFKALDTNNDGVIDFSDDPYLPYYPGDDVVDWVGLSFYQYYINVLTTVDYFTSSLNPSTRNGLDAFYTRFSESRNKPMALGESGAPIVPTLPNNGLTEVEIKQSWWQSMFQIGITSSSPVYPNLKMYTQFEESKFENFDDMSTKIAHSAVKDYRFTFNNDVKAAFLQDYGKNNVFKWANQLNYGCDGGVSLK